MLAQAPAPGADISGGAEARARYVADVSARLGHAAPVRPDVLRARYVADRIHRSRATLRSAGGRGRRLTA